MNYKVTVYEKKKLGKIVVLCDEDVVKTMRGDMQDSNMKYLDIDKLIIPKDAIRLILVNVDYKH